MAVQPSQVSLPKPFSTGNVVEWFQCYEICSCTNYWDNDKKALKLPGIISDCVAIVTNYGPSVVGDGCCPLQSPPGRFSVDSFSIHDPPYYK